MTAVQTRQRLVEVALDLIWQSNYNSVGVNDICKQAGVTKGSFYHHFESKGDLFCKAHAYYVDSIRQELDTIVSPMKPALEQLEGFIGFLLRKKFGEDDQNCPGSAFLSAGSLCSENKVKEALKSVSEAAVRYHIALIRALDAEGYLEEGVDHTNAARFLHQYVQGATIYAKVHESPNQVREDLPEALYRLIGLKREFWYSDVLNTASESEERSPS